MQILHFNFNNKNYEIKKEGNEIKFLVNGYSASVNDKKLFYYIIKKLIPNNSIYINSLCMNGQEYKLYKDFRKGIYEFYPFNQEAQKSLNKIFNCQNEYVSSGLSENKAFKRIVKLGKKAVLVVLAASVILSVKTIYDLNISENSGSLGKESISVADIKEKLLRDLQEENIDTDKIEQEIETELGINKPGSTTKNNTKITGEESASIIDNGTTTSSAGYDSEKPYTSPDFSDITSNHSSVREILESALAKNPTLTEEEKAVFLKLENFIKANIDYIDLDWYSKILSSKRIDYIPGRNYLASAKNYNDNHMEIYDGESITEVSSFIITHELLHDFQRQNKDYWSGYIFFDETADVLFNNEYFNENDGTIYDSSYSININHIYAILEIIGPEPIKNYFFSGDINYIANALQEIIPDAEKSYVLIELLNQFMLTSSTIYQNFSTDTLLRSINYLLGEYYEAKYNRTINSDLLMLVYTGAIDYKDLCSFYGIEPLDVNYNFYQLDNIKYYLNSDKLCENEVEFQIVTGKNESDDFTTTTISITDENRYLNIVEMTR